MEEVTTPLSKALKIEGKKFEECYLWLRSSMPYDFFEEVPEDTLLLITHGLVGFELQDFFCTLNLKRQAVVLTLDSIDADLKILEDFSHYTIKTYLSFVSTAPLPFSSLQTANPAFLRIGLLHFTEGMSEQNLEFPIQIFSEVVPLVHNRNPEVKKESIAKLIEGIHGRFIKALPIDRLAIALDLYFRAQKSDLCQYETLYQEDWEEKKSPSLQIILAWKNTPKHHFLWRLAYTIFRHRLIMRRVNATYVDPYSQETILIMVLDLHGSLGKAAWDECSLPNFLRELVLVKNFAALDPIDDCFVRTGLIEGFMGNFLRALHTFVHQALVQIDANIYTPSTITEALIRHPELTIQLCKAVSAKFDPQHHDIKKFEQLRRHFVEEVSLLDTGNEELDLRRKNVLRQAMNFLHFTLKTNLFMSNYSALSFRLDPKYLEELAHFGEKKLIEVPYAIFFIKGMHFFGFHIRFKDLARGGLRTIFPEEEEKSLSIAKEVFNECYNLAWTQQKKNKDIPEGGAKGIIFLSPYKRIASEMAILKKELAQEPLNPTEAEDKIDRFAKDQRMAYLYEAQRAFIENLLVLINMDETGHLREKKIVDYLEKSEYLYLGPDENMHNSMIQWIADTAKKVGYLPGSSFISSKPRNGINHKEYGVTSLGLNVYVEELLRFSGIDPKRQSFTVKMSGGPDGDVAGNEILQLYKNWETQAKLLAMTDISGTIYDPRGLDLALLVDLFHQKKPLRHYPPEKLHDSGFLLNKEATRRETALSIQTLLWKKEGGKVVERWLSGSDMNLLLRTYLHKVKADIFIPAGGRPRTLNEKNFKDFLDEAQRPSSRLIVEGANLYITPRARVDLEQMGVFIIKDSSANKTGVICSSFEVLSNLALGDDLFVRHKERIVQEILDRVKICAKKEAHLIIKTHQETGNYLTEISDKISERINKFTAQILDFLEPIALSQDRRDPLIRAYFAYALPILRTEFSEELLNKIPDLHKKACIACHVSSEIVYRKGLDWFPTLPDILPSILEEISA